MKSKSDDKTGSLPIYKGRSWEDYPQEYRDLVAKNQETINELPQGWHAVAEYECEDDNTISSYWFVTYFPSKGVPYEEGDLIQRPAHVEPEQHARGIAEFLNAAKVVPVWIDPEHFYPPLAE